MNVTLHSSWDLALHRPFLGEVFPMEIQWL